jgi:hypothetical protein
MKTIIQSDYQPQKSSLSIDKYTKESWIIRFLPLIGKHKKILLVSDFVNKIG